LESIIFFIGELKMFKIIVHEIFASVQICRAKRQKWLTFLIVVAFFNVLLSSYLKADYFDYNECPYTVPPCYKFVYSGITDCTTANTVSGTVYGAYINEGCGLQWLGAEEGTGVTAFIFFSVLGNTLVGAGPSFSAWCNSYEYGAGWDWYLYNEMAGSWPESGTANNMSENSNQCLSYNIFGWKSGFGGTISWTPEWDCSACNMCDDLVTHVAVCPNDAVYYSNLACCPPGAGETGSITLSCENALYVKPMSPIITGNAALVKVIYDSNCQSGSSITYTIQTIPTDPTTLVVKTATVTCKAAFFTQYGQKDSASGSISVKPKCSKCCEKGSGCPAAGL
jgi:hypothetical protein